MVAQNFAFFSLFSEIAVFSQKFGTFGRKFSNKVNIFDSFLTVQNLGVGQLFFILSLTLPLVGSVTLPVPMKV